MNPSTQEAALSGTSAKVQISAERSNSGANPRRQRGRALPNVKMSSVFVGYNQNVKGLKARPSINFNIV